MCIFHDALETSVLYLSTLYYAQSRPMNVETCVNDIYHELKFN